MRPASPVLCQISPSCLSLLASSPRSAPDHGNLIAVPVSDNERGNPVLWSRRFFMEVMTLDGHIGAWHLIAKHSEAAAEVPVEGFGAFLDIDTPQALAEAQRG